MKVAPVPVDECLARRCVEITKLIAEQPLEIGAGAKRAASDVGKAAVNKREA